MSRAPGFLRSLPGLAVLSAVVALVVFSNRAELVWALGWLLLVGGAALLLARRAWRAPRSPGQQRAVLASALALAAVSAVAVTTDHQAAARCVVQWLLVLALLAGIVHRRAVAREWRGLLLLAASTGLCLLLLSWLGPFLLHNWLLPHYTLDLDHRPVPGSGGANEDGVYSSEAAGQFRAADENILFLGDSFTANIGLRYEQRFPALVEAMLRRRLGSDAVHTVNFGWVSSSPILQARQLRAIGAKYAPDLVVQCLDLTDFHDDLKAVAWLRERGLEPGGITIFRVIRARASFALGVPDFGAWVRERAWWLPSRPADALPYDRWFALRRPWTESAAQLDVTWRAILETREIARSLGARFAVFAFPRYQQYDRSECPRDWERPTFPPSDEFLLEPFKYLEDRARGADFPVHVLLEEFARAEERPLCMPDDPHWTAAGNRVVARAIVRHLLEDGLVRPGS